MLSGKQLSYRHQINWYKANKFMTAVHKTVVYQKQYQPSETKPAIRPNEILGAIQDKNNALKKDPMALRWRASGYSHNIGLHADDIKSEAEVTKNINEEIQRTLINYVTNNSLINQINCRNKVSEVWRPSNTTIIFHKNFPKKSLWKSLPIYKTVEKMVAVAKKSCSVYGR